MFILCSTGNGRTTYSTVFKTGRLILTVSENDMLCFSDSVVRRIAFFPAACRAGSGTSRQAYSQRVRSREREERIKGAVEFLPRFSRCLFESDLSSYFISIIFTPLYMV
jgi:hypothetical protein